MYNNNRKKIINNIPIWIWFNEIWQNSIEQIPLSWLVWYWPLNWTWEELFWKNWTATNVTWTWNTIWYTKSFWLFWTSKIVVPYNSLLNPSNFTISLSFRWDTFWTNNDRILEFWWYLIWWWYTIDIWYQNQMVWWVWNWTTNYLTRTNSIITKWVWYHFIFEFDWTNTYLYLNNNLDVQWTWTMSINNSSSLKIWVQNSRDASYFKWWLQNIRLYNRLLTKDEKRILYKEHLALLH